MTAQTRGKDDAWITWVLIKDEIFIVADIIEELLCQEKR
jgi:hypothetical protein